MLKPKASILWPPHPKSWLIGKDPDAGKESKQGEMTEDEMVGWHHRLNGQEFEQAPGGGEGQGSLACCSPWGHRIRHTEWLNNKNKIQHFLEANTTQSFYKVLSTISSLCLSSQKKKAKYTASWKMSLFRKSRRNAAQNMQNYGGHHRQVWRD